MNFEVYCDESCLEAFSKKEAHNYIGIGGIWIPSENRKDLKSSLIKIKTKYSINREFKWNKISPHYFNSYKDIIDYFFTSNYLRFRVIIIESERVDNYKFHNSDSELSFYKFYYQLLHHWIFDFNNYDIFLDYKLNRNKGRLNELKKVLQNANLTSNIRLVQGIPSEQSLGIQLADILTGAVTAKFNNNSTSKAKLRIIDHIEKTYLKKTITNSPKWEEKFNVFKINLQGGW